MIVGGMDPRIQALWVEALRSGEFQQGRGALRKGGKYCCLGVLCELHRREMQERDWKVDNSRDSYYGADASLPRQVIVWAGFAGRTFHPLAAIHPVAQSLDTTNSIACSLPILNDVKGYSFATIADAIEHP